MAYSLPIISLVRGLLAGALLALPLLGFSQETRKVTKADGQWLREVFYVLKSDKNVRHGRYEVHRNSSSQPVAVGYYRQGRKDSTWTEYAPETGRVLVKGAFHDDQPVGVWTFYTRTGMLSQQYDYTTHQVLLSRPEGQQGWVLARLPTPGPDGGPQRPDIEPQYIGGMSALQGHYMTVQFPRIGVMGRVNGEAQVVGTIGVDGHVSNWRVIPSSCGGCDQAMLDMLKKLPNHWIPAEYGGQPVATEVLFTMKFLGIQPRM
ncbi:energy transducer TonB [Hymenobacter chitinivorans]|uniref:TonB-like protein n=1 Tax=Hymenobacter chitinivorans DSM 11115 TaxID=1121954 RepID=A0A2M9B947_9BACT|nr:energy transducer TonB [Hymenobacter chitinivorans]PJJ54437.1 TonB-like protein [Hymenobacter chitinivorans DSM 11115]